MLLLIRILVDVAVASNHLQKNLISYLSVAGDLRLFFSAAKTADSNGKR